MKTLEEIKAALKKCNVERSCENCPYFIPYSDTCTYKLGEDSLRYIEQFEERFDLIKEENESLRDECDRLNDRIDLMLIQMRGDCGCCKYNSSGIMNRHGVYGDSNKCFECLDMWNGKPETYHPLWEYEGLPGDEQTEGKNHETS